MQHNRPRAFALRSPIAPACLSVTALAMTGLRWTTPEIETVQRAPTASSMAGALSGPSPTGA